MNENPWEKKYSSDILYRNNYPFDIIVSLVIKKFRQIGRKIRVLELGCGCGNNLIPLADYYEYAYGIDVSPTALDYARSWAAKDSKDNLNFLIKDLNEEFFLDYNKKFDLIFDRGCLSLIIPNRLEDLISKLSKNYLESDGNLFLSLFADSNSSLELNKVNSSNFSEIGSIKGPEVFYYSRKDLLSFTKFDLKIEKFDYISRVEMSRQKYIYNSEWNVLYTKLNEK